MLSSAYCNSSRDSGCDLRKVFATTGMRHCSDSSGSICPALKRLEARGWIEHAIESHLRSHLLNNMTLTVLSLRCVPLKSKSNNLDSGSDHFGR